jgi:hypothetical protein
MRNPHHGGHGNQERRSFNLEGPGPKAIGSNVHDACFPKAFEAPNNIINYEGKTNPNVCLQDYCLMCRWAG